MIEFKKKSNQRFSLETVSYEGIVKETKNVDIKKASQQNDTQNKTRKFELLCKFKYFKI